jgi:hypothetical protein
LSVVGWIHAWDPYPFILLNLTRSFQAAYTAPILMMGQNRQAEIDRRKAQINYRINIKAELEVEQLHRKDRPAPRAGGDATASGGGIAAAAPEFRRTARGLILVGCWRRPP